MTGPVPAGLLPVCKPPGPSSHQVVAAVRRHLGRGARVGHAGTLDPLAAGVLPVCTGGATRLAEFLQIPEKRYRFELVLGCRTDTQDAAGRVVARADPSEVSEAALREALAAFVGEVRQSVPLYSARRRDGRRLYEFARGGEALPVPRPEAKVRIHRLDLLLWHPGASARALCEVRCSAGTYVRALCEDIGLRLGVGAHMGSLVRTAAGGVASAQCRTLEEIDAAAQDGALRTLLVPPARALAFLPAVAVDPAEADGVGHGRPPGDRVAAAGDADGPVRVLDGAGSLLAVARRRVRGRVVSLQLLRVLTVP